MRHTTIIPEEASTFYAEQQLDAMWLLIENSYEEDWHVEANGDLTLEVDADMLTRVLEDNPEVAARSFSAHEEHNPENERYEWVNLPEHLCGTYTIKGVYNAKQQRLDVLREYFFTQEGA